MNASRTLVVAFGVALLGGCATGDIERPSTNQGKVMHFKNLDKNGDGVLTLDELPPDLDLSVNFERYDRNGNGVINEYEFGDYINSIPD